MFFDQLMTKVLSTSLDKVTLEIRQWKTSYATERETSKGSFPFLHPPLAVNAFVQVMCAVSFGMNGKRRDKFEWRQMVLSSRDRALPCSHVDGILLWQQDDPHSK